MKTKVPDWDKINYLYLKWLKNNNLKKYLLKNLCYKNFSVWWISNLFRKDNIKDNKWYFDLKKILIDKKNVKFNLIFFLIIFNLKFFKNLIVDIFFNLFVKLYLDKQPEVDKENCFFSILHNIKYFDRNLAIDRVYDKTPLFDQKNDSFYLIKIENIKDFLVNRKEYLSKLKLLNKKYEILDHHIKLLEILRIYFFCYLSFIKCFNKFFSDKKNFRIDKHNCYNVLYPHMLNSFASSVQRSLITSMALYERFKKQKPIKFINYLEFAPGTVSFYSFIRRASLKNIVVTIQHSYVNKNILYYNNHKNDFTKKNFLEGVRFCPSPDYYLIYSENLRKLLKSYFKKNFFLIGKLTSNYQKKLNQINISHKIRKIKPFILIAPNLGDGDLICEFFKNFNNTTNYNFILSPHPADFEHLSNKFKEIENDNIKFIILKKIPTQVLLKFAELVICSASSIAIDAKLLSTDSIRLASNDFPIFFDKKEPIKVIETKKKFHDYLKNFKVYKNKSFKKNYHKFYYYKNDGQSVIRFWRLIKKMKIS